MLRNLTSGRFLSPNSELIPKLIKYSAVLMLEFQELGDLQIEVFEVVLFGCTELIQEGRIASVILFPCVVVHWSAIQHVVGTQNIALDSL